MAAAYSRRFCLAYAGQAEFLVPAGKRVVVKSITANNDHSGVGWFVVSIGVNRVLSLNVPAGTGLQTSGLMIVLEQGETLKLVATPAMSAQASGYLLDA